MFPGRKKQRESPGRGRMSTRTPEEADGVRRFKGRKQGCGVGWGDGEMGDGGNGDGCTYMSYLRDIPEAFGDIWHPAPISDPSGGLHHPILPSIPFISSSFSSSSIFTISHKSHNS